MKKFMLFGLLLVFMGSAAWANTEDVYREVNGPYLDLSVQYLMLDLPDYSPIALEDQNFFFLDFLDGSDGRDEAVMPGFVVGVPIPALNIILELGAEVADWNGGVNKVYDYAATNRVGWLPLDGSQYTIGFGGGDDVAARINRSGDYCRFELMSKYPLYFSNLTIVPFIGPSFMSLEEDFSLRANEVQTPGNRLLQDEELDSDYIGVRGGVTLVGKFCHFASWELTPSVGIYYLEADYRGHQEDIGVIGYTASAKDGEDRTSMAAGVQGKVTLQYEQLSLSFIAGLDYLEDVAGIRHSTLGLPPFDENAGGRAAHLVFESSLNTRFGIELGVRFW